MEVSDTEYEYDVALSFAGQERGYVETVARLLKNKGFKVFYDQYETVSISGENLFDHLYKVYNKLSFFSIMFISEHYVSKFWTNHEKQSILARVLRGNKPNFLPVRFDDSVVPGLDPETAYLEANKISPYELAEIIELKINLLKKVDSTKQSSNSEQNKGQLIIRGQAKVEGTIIMNNQNNYYGSKDN